MSIKKERKNTLEFLQLWLNLPVETSCLPSVPENTFVKLSDSVWTHTALQASALSPWAQATDFQMAVHSLAPCPAPTKQEMGQDTVKGQGIISITVLPRFLGLNHSEVFIINFRRVSCSGGSAGYAWQSL